MTVPLAHITETHSDDTVAENEWWRDCQFHRFGPLAGWLNAMLRRECQNLEAAFANHVEHDAYQELLPLIRGDAVAMSRWDVASDAIVEVARKMYALIRDVLGWLVALAATSLVVSDGARWIGVFLLVAAVVVALLWVGLDSVAASSKAENAVVLVWLAFATLGLIAMVALLLDPSADTDFGGAVTAVATAVVSTVLLVSVTHSVLSRYWSALAALIVMLLVVGVAVALWEYADTPGWPQGLPAGLETGLAVGLGASFALATIQFANASATKVLSVRKRRLAAEAEFVQSTLLAIAAVESLRDPAAAQPLRATAIANVEYTAAVLEKDVRATLAREDPGSAVMVADELSSRAKFIRERNRAVLLGRPDAQATLLRALVANLGYSAHRDWLALPSANGPLEKSETRQQRVSRFTTRLAVLGVPVALLIVFVFTDQKELLPFAALWTVVQLLNLAKPGAGDLLSKSAADAGNITSPLSGGRS